MLDHGQIVRLEVVADLYSECGLNTVRRPETQRFAAVTARLTIGTPHQRRWNLCLSGMLTEWTNWSLAGTCCCAPDRLR